MKKNRDVNSTLKPAYLSYSVVLILLAMLIQPSVIAQRKTEVPIPEFPFMPPQRVSIFPVFFVASDQPNPPPAEAETLRQHLSWAQDWYRKQLRGKSTFRIFSDQAYLYRGRHPLAHYVSQEGGKRAPLHLIELLEHFRLTRFNCPFVFVMIVDKLDERPNGGRPINSGFNGGGGIVQMARKGLARPGAFQGILRHELGHSFGLQHVTLYGYDMKTNLSVMSYNHGSRPKGLKESQTPQILIPEDIRVLALNDRVFPNLTFDPQRHVPRGYSISPKMSAFSPIPLPGHPPDRIEITSLSGESVGSRAKNLVRKQIVPNERSKTNKQGTNYNSKTMWHSDKTLTEYRSLMVKFPVETSLTAVRIHSQHSGKVHPVTEFRASTLDNNETTAVDTKITTDNQLVTFPLAKSRKWRLDFKPGKSGKVVLRGLQFYFNETELYAAITSETDSEPTEADDAR